MIMNRIISSDALLLLVSCIVIGTSLGTDNALSIRNGAVIRGATFHLRCSSDDLVCGALQWLKKSVWGDEETISYGRSLMSNYGGRYAMNDSGKPCDVTVSNVQISDAGEFVCVAPDKGRQSAYLTVLDSAPRCWTDATDGLVLEGDELTLHCSIDRYQSVTEPRLQWLDSYNQPVITVATSQMPGAINSTFNVRAAQSPAVLPFMCRVSFGSNDQTRGAARNVPEVSCSTQQIHVVYPVRDIRLQMNGTRLTSGKLVTCVANGQPPPSYRWVTLTTGDVTHSNQIVVVTGHVYQCEASNMIRGRTYREKSWEIYVLERNREPERETSSPHRLSTISPTASSSSSSSSSPPSTSTSSSLTTLTSSSTSIYSTTSNSLEEPVHINAHVVTVSSVDVMGRVNNVNLSSLVLGVLLLVSLVVIFILIVRLCGLRDRLKNVERLQSNGGHVTKQSPHSPIHAVTVGEANHLVTPSEYSSAARPHATSLECNGAVKSKVNSTTDSHPEVVYTPLSKPVHVSNGKIHNAVYLDVDTRT